MVLKAIKNIIHGLALLVYLIIILCLIIAAPMLLRWRPVVVLSGSMEPAYQVGGLIYYKHVDFDEISVGDAITFKIGDGSLATHRVVEIDKDSQAFTTKGDNNDANDMEPVNYSDVVGIASDICVPYAGYFVSYIKALYMILIMAAILVADMLISAIIKRKTADLSLNREIDSIDDSNCRKDGCDNG